MALRTLGLQTSRDSQLCGSASCVTPCEQSQTKIEVWFPRVGLEPDRRLERGEGAGELTALREKGPQSIVTSCRRTRFYCFLQGIGTLARRRILAENSHGQRGPANRDATKLERFPKCFARPQPRHSRPKPPH